MAALLGTPRSYSTVDARMPRPNPEYDPQRAGQWWNRRSGKPLDLEAMAERYRSRDPAGKPPMAPNHHRGMGIDLPAVRNGGFRGDRAAKRLGIG